MHIVQKHLYIFTKCTIASPPYRAILQSLILVHAYIQTEVRSLIFNSLTDTTVWEEDLLQCLDDSIRVFVRLGLAAEIAGDALNNIS